MGKKKGVNDKEGVELIPTRYEVEPRGGGQGKKNDGHPVARVGDQSIGQKKTKGEKKHLHCKDVVDI